MNEETVVDLNISINTLKLGSKKLTRTIIKQFMLGNFIDPEYNKESIEEPIEGELIAKHRIGLSAEDEGVMYLWRGKDGEIFNGKLSSEMLEPDYHAADFITVREIWFDLKSLEEENAKLLSGLERDGIPKWAINNDNGILNGTGLETALKALSDEYEEMACLDSYYMIDDDDDEETKAHYEELNKQNQTPEKKLGHRMCNARGKDILDFMPSYEKVVDQEIISKFKDFCSAKKIEVDNAIKEKEADLEAQINKINQIIEIISGLPIVYAV